MKRLVVSLALLLSSSVASAQSASQASGSNQAALTQKLFAGRIQKASVALERAIGTFYSAKACAQRFVLKNKASVFAKGASVAATAILRAANAVKGATLSAGIVRALAGKVTAARQSVLNYSINTRALVARGNVPRMNAACGRALKAVYQNLDAAFPGMR